MKIYAFSEKSVKMAEAANLLGFDVIEKEAVPILQGRHTRIEVSMSNTKTRCILDNTFFPELLPGDKISISYIMHWKQCNESYMKVSADDVTEALIPAIGYELSCGEEQDFDENGAGFLTNFKLTEYEKYAVALRKFREICPEKGSYIFLKKTGWKYCNDPDHGSVWMTKNVGDLHDFWEIFREC